MPELFDTKKSVQIEWGNTRKSIIYFAVSLLPLFFAYAFFFDGNPNINPKLGFIPLAIALVFIISGLASSFNVTTFLLKGNQLVSSTKPIPIGGKIDLPIHKIKCFKAQHYTNSSSGGNFYLTVEFKEGRKKRIPIFPISKAKAEECANILNSKYLKLDEAVK